MEPKNAPLSIKISGDVASDRNGDLSVLAAFWEDQSDLFVSSTTFHDVVRYGIHRGRLRFDLENVSLSLKPGTYPNKIPVEVDIHQADTKKSGSTSTISVKVGVAALSEPPSASLGASHAREREKASTTQYSTKFHQVQLGGDRWTPHIDFHAYEEGTVLRGQVKELSFFALSVISLPARVTATFTTYPKDIVLTEVPDWLSWLPLARSLLKARLLTRFKNGDGGRVLFSLSKLIASAGRFEMIEDGQGPAQAMKEALALPERARKALQMSNAKQIQKVLEVLDLNPETDLRGVDLSNMDLTGADLRNFNLEGADLRNTTLKNVNLEGTNFSYADFEGAEVSAASLDDKTAFHGARFMNAQLEGIGPELIKNARLGGAILEGAKIASARDVMRPIAHADYVKTIIEKATAAMRADMSTLGHMKLGEDENSIEKLSQKFTFCHDNAEPHEVAHIMRTSTLDSIPVVDRSENVVGTIRNIDVANYMGPKIR